MREASTYKSKTACAKGHVIRYIGSNSCQQCNIEYARARKDKIRQANSGEPKLTGGKPRIIKSMPAMANFLAGEIVMSKKDGGCERLLKALMNGEAIDPLVAWSELGIYRLAARIHDLKTKRGVTGIKKSSRYVVNRFGEKAGPVAVYTLKKESVLVA